MNILRWGVAAAAVFSIAALSWHLARTLAYGRKPLFSKPRGSVLRGIFYAFGPGMTPWEKESARKHLATYAAGVIYHGGIFLALLHLALIVAGVRVPGPALQAARWIFAAAFLAGCGLLVKRIVKPGLRAISCPDDYVSSGIVGLFLVLSWLVAGRPETAPVLFAVSILMFLYIPAGKIRHCAYFFYSRILFGRFFGRRGTLPGKTELG